MLRPLLNALLVFSLCSCATTGDPSQGGLFGWSQSKADVRIESRSCELFALEQKQVLMKSQTTELERDLEACIREAASENAATRRWIETLNHKLADYKKRVATARALNDRKELAKIDRELKALDKQVAGEVKDYKENVALQRQLIAKLPTSHNMFARVNRTLNQSVECHDLLAAADILGASRSMPSDQPPPQAADRQDVPDPDALKKGGLNKLQEVPDPDALKRGRQL